ESSLTKSRQLSSEFSTRSADSIGGIMSGKRSASLVVFLALLMSVLVNAPSAAAAAADTEADTDQTDGTVEELSADDEFEKVLLTPDVPQPMSMDIADDGRVFITSRDGVVRVYHPDTGQLTVAAELSVFDDHPLP